MADDFETDSVAGETVGETLAKAFEEHTGERASKADPPREAAVAAETDSESETASREWSKSDTTPSHGDDSSESDTDSAKPARSSKSEISSTSWADRNPEMFGRLPLEGQRYVRELERRDKDSAVLREHYDPVRKLFEPHASQMKQAGMTPAKMIEGWSKAETRLLDPSDRANMVAEIIHTYGIDPREVANALQNLPNRVAATQQRRQEVAERGVMAAIDAFKGTKGRDGKPLYPHFGELENKMAELARSNIGAGKPPAERLKALYDAALWTSPKHRQAAIAARDRARGPSSPIRMNGASGPKTIREAIDLAMRAS